MSDELPSAAFKLAFPDFVEVACDWLEARPWDEDTDSELFDFVRALKAHPHTGGMTADRAYESLRGLAAAPDGPAIWPGIGLFDEDGVVAFHRMWERVRFPMGTDPVQAACGLAGDGMIRSHKSRPGRYTGFLTAAALLQIQRPQRPIMLPARKVAEHVHCQPMTVSGWTGWALDDGVLVRTKVHSFKSGGGSKAAEYVFGLHRWPKDAIDRIAERLGLPVRDAHLAWIREQFAETKDGPASEDSSGGSAA